MGRQVRQAARPGVGKERSSIREVGGRLCDFVEVGESRPSGDGRGCEVSGRAVEPSGEQGEERGGKD